MPYVQGSVVGKAHAQARSRRQHATRAAFPEHDAWPSGQLEPSLNGPHASLAGRSYSEAGADQDISSPKRQPAVSSAQGGPAQVNHEAAGQVVPDAPVEFTRLQSILKGFSYWQGSLCLGVDGASCEQGSCTYTVAAQEDVLLLEPVCVHFQGLCCAISSSLLLTSASLIASSPGKSTVTPVSFVEALAP